MNESKRRSILIFTLALLLLLIFSPTLSYSKGEDWQKVSGPWDQKFESSFGTIAVDPTSSNIIYLANEGGAGIYKSVDGGVSWHTANRGIPKLNSSRKYFPISGIFVNPYKPTTIYSSTATPFSADPWDPIARGIFKSKTGGNSWKKSNGKSGQASLPKGEGGGVLSIFRLVGDHNHPDTLYTSHAIGGIYKTVDGGSTWLEKNNGLPKDPIFGLHVNVLEVDPSNTNTLYAAPYINYSVSYLRDKGPQPQGIYKTVDGGDHWAELDTGSIILPLPWDLATFVTSLKVSPHHSNTIYFGTSDKGIYKSTDGGNSWVEVNGTGDNKIPQDAMGYYQINCLVMDPLIPNTIYAGLNNGGVYKSNDGGANWSSYNNGLDAGIDVNDLSFISDRLYATTSKGVYVTDMLPRLQGDESSFYGALLSKVLGGLVSGAAGKIGGDIMGQILDLLGYGGSGDQGQLDAMSQKLDQIVSLLNDIKNELDQLLVQLKITEEEILANTNDPTNAITQITSAHEELQGLSKKSAGGVDQTTLTGFTNRVENVYNIYAQVNTIHDAILPPTEVKAPVLNNFTDLSINKGNSLTDTYLGLEQYFSQLLYYQMEGVNLIVETKIYREKAGLPQIDGRDAQAYMDFFMQNKLNPQVDNFMNNVYRLILKQVNLVDSASFLPSEAQGILSRANFFRVQALNQDHFGLRGTLIAAQDLVKDIIQIKARNSQGQIIPFKTTGTALSTLSGKTYDYWEGNKVKPSSTYTVIEYDFGDVPLGNYDILDANNNVIGSASVKTYKDDYTVDASGTIHYGHFVIAKRMGGTDAFINNAGAVWSFNWQLDESVTARGGANLRWEKLEQLNTKVGDWNYKGDAQLRVHFVYSGDGSKPLTIYYGAHAYGRAVTEHYEDSDRQNNAYAKISYEIGLWDATTSGAVNWFKSNSVEAKRYGGETSLLDDDILLDKDGKRLSFTFNNPSPGHEYYFYFNIHIEGKSSSGEAMSYIIIDMIDGKLYITF
jgi:photosystem II stability/assembly factor-like uncharacterized protein